MKQEIKVISRSRDERRAMIVIVNGEGAERTSRTRHVRVNGTQFEAVKKNENGTEQVVEVFES